MDNDIKEIKNDVQKIQEDYDRSVENACNYLENIYINYHDLQRSLKLFFEDLDYIDGIVDNLLNGEDITNEKKRLAKIDPSDFYRYLNSLKYNIDLMQDDFKSLFIEVKNITK